MLNNCQWVIWTDANGKPCCRSVCCGHVMAQTDPTKCFASCRKKKLSTEQINLTCTYLGTQLETIAIKCKTCQGNVRIKHTVHECKLFGKCLPNYNDPYSIETKDYQLCLHCPKYATS